MITSIVVKLIELYRAHTVLQCSLVITNLLQFKTIQLLQKKIICISFIKLLKKNLKQSPETYAILKA